MAIARWEYIDGDAERYLQAGVVKTLTSDYKFKGQIDAVADIYFMKSAEGAKKVFEAEPSEGSKPASVGVTTGSPELGKSIL